MTKQEKYELLNSQLKKRGTIVCYKFYHLATTSDRANRGKSETALLVEQSSCTTFFYRYVYYPQLEGAERADYLPLDYVKFDNSDVTKIQDYLEDVIMIKNGSGKVLWSEDCVLAPNNDEKCFILGKYLYRESELLKIIDAVETRK